MNVRTMVDAWKACAAERIVNPHASSLSPFICGAAVELHGLTATALNGSRGRLLSSVDPITTRAKFRFAAAAAQGAASPPTPPREALIKVENLRIVPFTAAEKNLNAANERLLCEKIFARRYADEIIAILQRPTNPNATMPLSHGWTLFPRVGFTTHAEVGIQGCEPGSSALNLASQFGDAEIIKALMAAGSDSMWRVETIPESQCGALHVAARCGKVEAIAALLDAGAEIELNSDGFFTALLHATMYRRINCVKLLLERGAYAEMIACPGAPICCLQIAMGNGDQISAGLLLDAMNAGIFASEMAHCLDASEGATAQLPPALITKIRDGLGIAPDVHLDAVDGDGLDMVMIKPLIIEANKMMDTAEKFLGRKKKKRDLGEGGPPHFFC